MPGAGKHQIVISADSHGGGSIDDYVEYLEPARRDEFHEWRSAYSNPFRDLQASGRERNWDSDMRLAEQHADGVVGEVLFPNTVPPFFPTGSLLAAPPSTREKYERRWAGLKAHNRWLADFCSEAPNQRAGVFQIFLNDVDDAVEEIRWAAANGNLKGGVLLPGVPPDSGLDPLFTRTYDPIWQVCQELGVVVNHHTGSAQPNYGNAPVSWVIFSHETAWFAHRGLWHTILGGVFERFPEVTFVVTEQGMGWIPDTLAQLDALHRRVMSGRGGEVGFPEEARLPMKPSEYWARNCWVGASFPSPREVQRRHKIGVDKIMWGSDYPHHEGVWPHVREHLRRSFADVPADELHRMLAANAAHVYGFDLDALRPVADEHGPTLDELAEPLVDIPAGATSMSFHMP